MVVSTEIASETRLVRDVVYDKLKEAILTQHYKPGSHLNERELALQFNISTTPLKEALGLLKQEGLVITRPRVGTFVSNDVMHSLEEINMVRAALEGVAARLAATKIIKDEIQALRKAFLEMEKHTENRNTEQIIVSNEQFHKLIRAFARNNYVYKQIESIRSFDSRFRTIALSQTGEPSSALREHRQIFKKISAKDPDGAEASMRLHIHNTTERVKQRTTLK
jgi:DNA-binding GntR family transcriptional regulator